MAIPVIGFLVLPLCFLSLLLSLLNEAAATQLFTLADSIIEVLLLFMRLLVEWGADAWQLNMARPGFWELCSLCIVLLLLLLPRALCRRSLIVPLLLPFMQIWGVEEKNPDEQRPLRLHIVDVGQGLAVIVETQRHSLVYDSGANLSPDFNMGSAVLIPVLRSLRISSLDAVVISHGDNDHAGGLKGLQANIKIYRLISNESRHSCNLQTELCSNTLPWKWDAVEFHFLQQGLNYGDGNNSSCVLQIRYADRRILLPGDIEREAEAQLALTYGGQLASDLLIAPHHGSSSSSSYALLKLVQPSYVVFSVGYRNSFGHPNAAVLARYKEFKSQPLITANTGMISFDFESGSAPLKKPRLQRQRNSRYWN